MMGHLSKGASTHLLQPASVGQNSLWQAIERYLAARRVSLGEFRRRHRLDRSFVETLKAGGVLDTHPATARLRRVVEFGPTLRNRRAALGVSLRGVEKETGIKFSRLFRAERLLAELTTTEKRQIDRFLAGVEKRLNRERQATHRREQAALLRRSRSEKGLTQAELAVALGCERKAIGRWEKDGSIPAFRLPRLESILPSFSAKSDENAR